MENPFRPGAGHRPPYLAGREDEKKEFRRLLKQSVILENMVLTGLRGVGKTVLLEELKPIAIHDGWLWVGTDLSESASVDERSLVMRLCTDLSVVTSGFPVGTHERQKIGFGAEAEQVSETLGYGRLIEIYNETAGLNSDKLKRILQEVWQAVKPTGVKGLIFAYDEAQILTDQAAKDQYPLSLLLDVFQSIQRSSIPMMLVLTGLPTLFPKLVEARTYAERMFRVVFLNRLADDESREAILKPIEDADCPVRLNEGSVDTIVRVSGGYPYFIQFICREVYDAFIHKIDRGQTAVVPIDEIQRKLDTDFFAGRWAKVTDRQRELLAVIASLDNSGSEFTVQEVSERSRALTTKTFSPSHVNQMLGKLSRDGLVFKNRHGKYSFAVPLLEDFIRRQKFEGQLSLGLEERRQ